MCDVMFLADIDGGLVDLHWRGIGELSNACNFDCGVKN